MQKTITWHCPRGCNRFDSDRYEHNEPPACGSCGLPMTMDHHQYNEALFVKEELALAEYMERSEGLSES